MDLDGTITREDTYLEFVRYANSTAKFTIGFSLLLPIFILWRLRMVKGSYLKERTLTLFFRGMQEQEFRRLGAEFARNILPGMVMERAREEIEMHREAGNPIIVVTGSFHSWVSDWCKAEGFELLATDYEVKDCKLTGKIQGINNTGAEKVRRIRENYDLESAGTIYAYGNSRNDLEMLGIAHIKYMKWQRVD